MKTDLSQEFRTIKYGFTFRSKVYISNPSRSVFPKSNFLFTKMWRLYHSWGRPTPQTRYLCLGTADTWAWVTLCIGTALCAGGGSIPPWPVPLNAMAPLPAHHPGCLVPFRVAFLEPAHRTIQARTFPPGGILLQPALELTQVVKKPHAHTWTPGGHLCLAVGATLGLGVCTRMSAPAPSTGREVCPM